jgi:hypothetical protein
MSKFVAVVITAAICVPLGALLHGDVSAERRLDDLSHVVDIEGHRNFGRAHAALHEALMAIDCSIQTHEVVWTDKTGRAAATKKAIEDAGAIFDRTADWLQRGMARTSRGPIFHRQAVIRGQSCLTNRAPTSF